MSAHGSGTVNVADMFKRVGAEAVLSTFIPIDARRNMILLNRLYTYISEAQKEVINIKHCQKPGAE